jgi:hypothetical protein
MQQMARFIDRLNAKGYSVVFIPHVMARHPSNNNLVICCDILRQAKEPDANILLSGLFSSIEAKSITQRTFGVNLIRRDNQFGGKHTPVEILHNAIGLGAAAYGNCGYALRKRGNGGMRAGANQNIAQATATEADLSGGKQPEKAAQTKALARENFELSGALFEGGRIRTVS